MFLHTGATVNDLQLEWATFTRGFWDASEGEDERNVRMEGEVGSFDASL